MTSDDQYRKHCEASPTDFLKSVAASPPARLTDRNVAIILEVINDRAEKGPQAIIIDAERFPWGNAVDAAIRASEENTARLIAEKRKSMSASL